MEKRALIQSCINGWLCFSNVTYTACYLCILALAVSGELMERQLINSFIICGNCIIYAYQWVLEQLFLSHYVRNHFCHPYREAELLFTYTISQALRGRRCAACQTHRAVILGFIPRMRQEAEESSSHSAFSLRLGSNRPLNLSSEESCPPLNCVISHLTHSQVHIMECRCFTCVQLCSRDLSLRLSFSHISSVPFQQWDRA